MIVVVGPTAVGKSDLALRLAGCFDAEIISADSRQVYRYMDIGTSKPSVADRAAVPHHVIDVVDPDEDFSLAMYRDLAIEALEVIKGKGKLPLLVGGSGLYVWSLVEGWRIPEVPPDRELRRRFEARAEREGGQGLYRELRDIDPASADRINPGNIRRIIRALEIYHSTGRQPSELQRKEAPRFPFLLVGLTQERGDLYRRIDRRVDKMMELGLVEEVDRLLKRGYSPSLPSMSGIGYKQAAQFLRGEMTLSEAVDKIKHETHRLARRQYAWFRLSDSRITWYHLEGAEGRARTDSMSDVVKAVKGLIGDFQSVS
ncbi:MAG: tRNA (adenosine(37)-N6)-dimethylallyltransferase MiaA [Dehalococcoidia bacterium]|nr:tRNA (adenosine(37)-N6)-dimethylallyltransferase MiaA [Dehalococcoidia bacterium]